MNIIYREPNKRTKKDVSCSKFSCAVGKLVGGCSVRASCIFYISELCPKRSLYFILCLFAVLTFTSLSLGPRLCWSGLFADCGWASESHLAHVMISFFSAHVTIFMKKRKKNIMFLFTRFRDPVGMQHVSFSGNVSFVVLPPFFCMFS